MAENEPSIINAGGDRHRRESVSLALRRAGYAVREAGNADEVLRLAAGGPRLLVLDADLPGSGGLEMCRRLKADAATAGLAVLLLLSQPVAGADEVADGCLTVPARDVDLIALVKTLIRGQALRLARVTAAWEHQTLIDSLEDGVCLVDADGVLLQANQAFAEFAGQPLEMLWRRPAAEVMKQRSLADGPELWQRLLTSTRRETVDCCGDERWFRFTSFPVRDPAGRLVARALCVARLTPADEEGAFGSPGSGERLEREVTAMERLALRSLHMPVTARAYGALPLREHVTELFEELVGRYTGVLEKAVEQRDYRVTHNVSDELRVLGEQLGFLGAGPRDVVDVHNEALKRRRTGQRFEKSQVYVEEGRFLVLELMGHLASHYRKYSLGVARDRVAGGAPDAGEKD